MKMLARAPTKWLGKVFVAGLFLSVFLLAKPLTAEAGYGWCHGGPCGCAERGLGDMCDAPGGACWYSTFDSSGHCVGHNFDDAWGAAGDCTHPAQIQAHCNVCGGWFLLTGYPARQHSWGAWTDYDANNHIHYCQNTSLYRIGEHGELPGGKIVTVYNACKPEYEKEAHTYGAWTDNGDGRHVRRCKVCGHAQYENHKFTAWTDNGDGRHVRHCKVCNRTEYGEHTYGDIKMEGSQSSCGSDSCQTTNAGESANGTGTNENT